MSPPRPTYGEAMAEDWGRGAVPPQNDQSRRPLFGANGSPIKAKPTVRGTPAFLDPLYVQNGGHSSELTDGFALGITALMTFTALPAPNILHRCRHMLMESEDRDRWQTPGMPDETAGVWPAKVACAMAKLVVGLSWEVSESRRTPPVRALEALEALAATAGVDGVTSCDDF